jgi:hypothetical protein
MTHTNTRIPKPHPNLANRLLPDVFVADGQHRWTLYILHGSSSLQDVRFVCCSLMSYVGGVVPNFDFLYGLCGIFTEWNIYGVI